MAKKKNLIGQKFHKLTVISEVLKHDVKNPRAMWNCMCECGENIIVSTNHLTTGNTKSCGCLKIEAIKQNQKLSLPIITKYEPYISTARRVWKSYCYQDKNCTISFEEWFKMSQQNCFYCDIIPNNIYNCFSKRRDASRHTKDNGEFIYNGLDRVNNSLPHTIDNIVTCCWICNRAKADRTTQDFYQYIATLRDNNLLSSFNLIPLPTNYLLTSIKISYRHYTKNYDNMEIDLQTFYTFSQLPCHYCGTEKSNYFNVYLKDKKASQLAKDGAHFYYNGIDRLDNTKTHTMDNIVPCCYYCNFAKGKLALPEFQAWIRRVKQFQQNKLVNYV